MTWVATPALNERTLAARSQADEVDYWKLACLTAALACLTLLSHHYSLESKAFVSLMAASTVGFVVHYLLPQAFRLRFFIVLSLGTLVWLLGPLPAAWLLGIGAVLIVIARLRAGFGVRVAMLVVAGAVLIAMRGGWVKGPVPAPVWPILASMFMFRMAAYLYDVRHEPSLASLPRALAYFFMLPNVCFPLFPVVDYKTFCRTYYGEERHRLHLVGVQWIFRGVAQLLLYRIVYQYFVTDPSSVETIADLAHYMLWPYLLYLRVSGQFHVIVGLLRLFGFGLPETHHAYYLASSFTDFWRRINIYWKDFMMKLFYYPSFFALRKRGETTALVLSTLVVFAATWALHSYQTFWIQGQFLLAWNDVLFWSLLAGLVVVNALREWRRGRQRRLTSRALTWRSTWTTVAATVAMFATICVLWSLWSTESLTTWLSLWSAAAVPPRPDQAWLVVLLLAVPVLIAIAVIAESRSWLVKFDSLRLEAQVASVVAVSALLVAVGTSRVYGQLGQTGRMIAAVRYGGLNQADLAGLERGYYENLMGLERFNGELWAIYMNRPADWERGLSDAGLSVETGRFPPYELKPSAQGRFKGAVLRTNRWGLHDKEYAESPPAGCVRMAILGASHAMGSGVSRDDTFEAVLERRLNERPAPDGPVCHEILNFAVYGYNPLFQLSVLDKVAAVGASAALYVGHPGDGDRVVQFVAKSVRERRALPFDDLNSLVASAGVDASMPERQILQRLRPLSDAMLSWLYGEMVERSALHGIRAAYVLLPMVIEAQTPVDATSQIDAARRAGFLVLDLSSVYRGSDRNALRVAEWDAHPNAAGHRLIAERLLTLIEQHHARLLGPRALAGGDIQ